MNWLSALGSDIWRHVQEFEIGPPRTVDQLMAWVGLFGLLIAAYKVARRVITRLRSRFGGPVARFHATVKRVESSLSTFRREENDGAFLPGQFSLSVTMNLHYLASIICLMLSTLGIGLLIGGIALILACAILLLFTYMLRQDAIELSDVIHESMGKKTTITANLSKADVYLNKSSDQFFSDNPSLVQERDKLRLLSGALRDAIVKSQSAIQPPGSTGEKKAR